MNKKWTPVPEVSPDTWRALLDTTRQLRALAPWEWMFDCHLLGFRDPGTEKVRLATVLGNCEEMYGVVIYRGQEGVRWLLNTLTGQPDPRNIPPEFCTDCVKLEFVRKSELEAPDLELYRRFKYQPRGAGAPLWPCYRSFQPGMFPWLLTQTEAQGLVADLRRVIEFSALCASEHHPFEGRAANEFPFYPCDPAFVGPVSARDLEWHQLYVPPVASPAPFAIATARQLEIARLPQIQDSAWELDSFFASMVVRGADRPYFPRLALVADATSGYLFGHVFGDQSQTLEETAGLGLLMAVERAGARPKELLVREDRLLLALRDAAKQCGIRIRKVEELPMVELARAATETRFGPER